MELCLLVEPSIVCFPRLCGISKFKCEHTEDLGAELVDFAQRYLDPTRALAVQYGTVTIEDSNLERRLERRAMLY
jgi:hypothetical protein